MHLFVRLSLAVALVTFTSCQSTNRSSALKAAPTVADNSSSSPNAASDNGAADIPAAGSSTFDVLFGVGGTYNVPYPFEALLKNLADRKGGAVAATLIPFGRSLQCFAAAPNFLQFPRVVAGVAMPPPNNPLFKEFVDQANAKTRTDMIAYVRALLTPVAQ